MYNESRCDDMFENSGEILLLTGLLIGFLNIFEKRYVWPCRVHKFL